MGGAARTWSMAGIGAVLAASVAASPQGGRIVGGEGSIGPAGGPLTVIDQRSSRLAVDWQSFDVAPGERVQFRQPSSQASALNRIFDQQPSQILGRVDANGRVLLMNPNGLVFGPHARLNVAGLVAAAGDLSPQAFMAGREQVTLGPGSVLNQGRIQGATGAALSLLGRQVINEGLLIAEAGRIDLVAGERMTVDLDGDGLLRYAVVDGAWDQAVDGPLLVTRADTRALQSQVVNRGTLAAGAVQRQGGRVRLVAPTGLVVNAGSIDVSGDGGGTVQYRGRQVEHRGSTRADAGRARGGAIDLAAQGDVLIAGESVLSARGIRGGGAVNVHGDRVALLDAAHLDVSGRQGGGSLSLGDVQTRRLHVDPAVTLRADALGTGPGGQVELWSEELTAFLGTASARGGEGGGDGGRVEVSSRRDIRYHGQVDVGAPRGVPGLLVLDPRNILLVDDGDADQFDLGGDPDDGEDDILGFSEDPDDTVMLAVSAVTDQLRKGSVLLQAHDDVQVNAAVDVETDDKARGSGLSLEAGDDIRINAPIDLNAGSLRLLAGIDTATPVDPDGTADIAINANVETNGGGVLVQTSGNIASAADINTSGRANSGDAGGDVELRSGAGEVRLGGAILARGADKHGGDAGAGGRVTVQSADGTVRLEDIDTRGGDSGSERGGDGGSIAVSAAGSGAVELAGQILSSGGSGHPHGGEDGGVLVTSAGGFVLQNINAGNGAIVAQLDGAGARELTVGPGLAGELTLMGGADDTLAGPDRNNLWEVTGADSGRLNDAEFSGFGNLRGGDGKDTFRIAAGELSGGLDGGGDDDVLSYAQRSQAVQIDLRNNSASGLGSAFANIERVVGSPATEDRLRGGDDGDTWTIDGRDQGNNGRLAFAAIENLAGGSGEDAFILASHLSGDVDGGDGADRFRLAGGGAARVLGGDGFDTIEGPDAPTVYTIDGDAAGSVGMAQPFQGVESLEGGAGDDHFVFQDGGALQAIRGGAGGNRLDFSGRSAPVNVDLAVGQATGIAAFADIARLRGSAGADTLIATDNADVVVVDARNAGTVNAVRFEGFENLHGRDGADILRLEAELTGTLAGGPGADRFELAGGAAALIDGGDGRDTLTRAAASTYTVRQPGAGVVNGTQAFQSMEVLQGGAEQDRFVLEGAGQIQSLAGEGGQDRLDFSSRVQPVTVDLGIGSATDVAEFSGIERFDGGAASDTLRSTDGADRVTVDAPNAGRVNDIAFASFEQFEAGAGDDSIQLAAPLSGALDAGSGDDVLLIAAAPPAVLAGGSGQDRAQFEGAVGRTDRLTLRDIETITGLPNHRLTVPELVIQGAAGGIGAAQGRLTTDVQRLDISAGGATFIRNLGDLLVARLDVGDSTFDLVNDGRLTQSSGDVWQAGLLALSLPVAPIGGPGAPIRTSAARLSLSTAAAGASGDIFVDAPVTALANVLISTDSSRQQVGLTSTAATLELSADLAGSGDFFALTAPQLSLDGRLAAGGSDVRLRGPLAVAGQSRIDTNGGGLSVEGPVQGPGALSVDAGPGAARFLQAIGAASPLQQLSVSAARAEVTTVATTGSQTYSATLSVAGDLSGSALAFGGAVQLLADVAMRSSTNTFAFGSAVGGSGNLALLAQGQGALRVGGAAGPGRLSDGAFRTYQGHLIVGAELAPFASPGQQARVVALEINDVLFDAPFATGGELTVLAGNITLNADVSAGDGSALNLVALGSSQGTGNGPGNIVGPTVGTAVLGGARAMLVANTQIINAQNIRLELNGGPALVAVANPQDTPTFNLGSNISTERFNPAAVPLLASLAVPLNIQPVQLVLSNPSQLVAVRATPFVDISVFEPNLSLVSILGEGVSKDVFQCEEAESCAAGLDNDGLDAAIQRLRERIVELERRLDAGEGDAEELRFLLEAYREQLRRYEVERSGADAEPDADEPRRPGPAPSPPGELQLSAAWLGL